VLKNSRRVMKKIINYIKDSYNELVYKVSWPTRAELTNSAVIVMIASIIMALIVWGIDSAFESIVKFFYSL
jgi:preprotein translocase subunit SecE